MNKKKLLADCLLIGLFIIVAVVSYVAFNSNSDDGQYVIVKVENQEVGRYSLKKNGVYELNGGTNILVIENGFAYLSDANCPDKLCVKQGKIHYSGQCITCLPNRLTVTVYGQGGVDF